MLGAVPICRDNPVYSNSRLFYHGLSVCAVFDLQTPCLLGWIVVNRIVSCEKCQVSLETSSEGCMCMNQKR